MSEKRYGDRITGLEVYQWPEFIALCDKLGIDWNLSTKELTIKLTVDDVLITQSFVPQKPFLDTTTLHNKEWMTKEPPVVIPCQSE